MSRFSYGQLCPIAKAAEVLGERWTILIIRELLLDNSRYSGLQRALSKISPTLLTKRLNQLQACGLVVRQTVPGQRRAEYHLTPAGRELGPVVIGLGQWGMRWARGQMGDSELDVQMLMVDFSRRIDRAQLPGGRVVIEFNFTGLPKFARWWIVVEADGERELCVDHPGHASDVQIRADLRTVAEIWIGDTDIQAARRDGRLRLSGEPALLRSLPIWLRPGALAHVRPHPDALKT
ncbi:MAG: transcriptional regulator [Opitutae bacterium]|nr:transcriptional regulator [Opitutae bacterium]